MVSPENQNFNTETIAPPETTFDESGLALSGLMQRVKDWRINRMSRQVGELTDSAELYRHAAAVSLDTKEPLPGYNPLANFASVHMSRRAGYGERPSTISTAPQAKTERQAKTSIRSRLRVDAINRHEHIMDQYDSLYPGMKLWEKSANIMSRENSGRFIPWGDRRTLKKQIDKELRNVPHSKSIEKGIQGAGKQILKSQRVVWRKQARLVKSESGKDIPGRVVDWRLQRKTAKIDKLKSNL